MQMGTITKVIGKTTKLKDLEFTSIWKERDMKGIGKMTNKMDRGRKHGLMGRSSLAHTRMGKRMDMESFTGLMEAHMMGSLRIMRLKGKELMNGLTREFIQANG